MYRIGVDLGGSKIAAGLVDQKNNIVSEISCPTKAKKGSEKITADIVNLCEKLRIRNNLGKNEVQYIGIACPGALNPRTGVVSYVSNLPFIDYPLCGKVASGTGIERVYIENDANAAALGEAIAGHTRNVSHSVLITIGTGIGAGVIIDKKIYSGFNFAASELGHMVIRHNGQKCSCGRSGCWEAYSAVPALVRITKEEMNKNPDSLMWKECGGKIAAVNSFVPFAAIRKGDLSAQKVLDIYISYLADGITNVVNILQPEIICIGGGLSNEKSILPPLKKLVDINQYTRRESVKTEISIASLGNKAGIIGASSLGGSESFD